MTIFIDTNGDATAEATVGPRGQILGEQSPDTEDSIQTDRLYTNIAEAIKNCRKIYFIYMSLLSYAFLTVVTTPDLNFVLNKTIELPILKTNIPGKTFLLFTPVLLIGMFVYIQLYLIKIDGMIKFTARYCRKTKKYKNSCPDPCCEKINNNDIVGCYLCEQQCHYIYPWILTLSRYSRKKNDSRLQSKVTILQRFFFQVSVWYFLPAALITFSLFGIKNHNVLSYLILGVSAIGMVIVRYFWIVNYLEKVRITRLIISFATLLTIITFLVALNVKAQQGIFFLFDAKKGNHWKTELNFYESILRQIIFIDLSHQKLVEEPDLRDEYKPKYWATFERLRLEGANFYSAILPHANLSHAQLKNAFMINAKLENSDLYKAKLDLADLSYASLKGAQLREADIINANLTYSDLSEAYLVNAVLKGADLEAADLINTTLGRADLSGANLKNARLRYAELYGTNLQSADLSEADLSEAKLDNANLLHANLENVSGLTVEQIKRATNWQMAYYSDELCRNLGLRNNHNDLLSQKKFSDQDLADINLEDADFEDADFSGANLESAVLKKANLRNTNFTGANLNHTNFQEADLRGVVVTDSQQLANVSTLYDAKLDDSLRIELESKYPHLFDKPSTEGITP